MIFDAYRNPKHNRAIGLVIKRNVIGFLFWYFDILIFDFRRDPKSRKQRLPRRLQRALDRQLKRQTTNKIHRSR